ncbi:GntR family transcriptional regulator [Actinomycetota bacterium]|nr:GntR family transcriptional regulator [Actinomycetota bacterium]
MFPFEVDNNSDIPIWVQLSKRIAYLINSGYYQSGEQLPTVRGLASEISINYNTVNKAYLSLLNDGYITSTRGRGAFVRNFDAEANDETSQAIDTVIDECITTCRELGLSLDDINKRVTQKVRKLKKDGTE